MARRRKKTSTSKLAKLISWGLFFVISWNTLSLHYENLNLLLTIKYGFYVIFSLILLVILVLMGSKENDK